MDFEKIYRESFYESVRLVETITGLEGRPMEPLFTDTFEKWLGSLRNGLWEQMIYKRLNDIRTRGKYGKDSHKCQKTKNKIYEIVFKDPPLRVYFVVLDDSHISLEGGSSAKSGSSYSVGSQQNRVIDAIDKRVSLRSKR